MDYETTPVLACRIHPSLPPPPPPLHKGPHAIPIFWVLFRQLSPEDLSRLTRGKGVLCVKEWWPIHNNYIQNRGHFNFCQFSQNTGLGPWVIVNGHGGVQYLGPFSAELQLKIDLMHRRHRTAMLGVRTNHCFVRTCDLRLAHFWQLRLHVILWSPKGGRNKIMTSYA